MKINLIILLIFLLVFFGCNPKIKDVNQFTSSIDTLVLKTDKIKGFGMFPAGAGEIHFRDTSERYLYPVVFPEGITNIKLAWQYIDYKLYQLEKRRKNKPDYIKSFLKYYNTKIDSMNIPSLEDNYIPILSGQREEDTVFIVDENNNKDFRDDSIRLYREMDWKSTSRLIKCKYRIFDGEKMTTDSTWVNIGAINGNILLFFVSHHLVSTFTIDHQKYQIGVVDDQSNFCFDYPLGALISENGINKDSLPKSEILNKGEYLKLGDRYYRFEDVSNNGRFITLVKENDVSNKIGTQVGFIAPDFKCHTTENDTISLKDYKGKFLLLINVTACWSPISSYEYYKELTKVYSQKIETIGIDNSPNILQRNIKDLNLTGKFTIADNNQLIKMHYREDYCSRTCFLINPKGRIIDKFEIRDWEKALVKHFNK